MLHSFLFINASSCTFNYVEVKFAWIAIGASQGNYFLSKSKKLADFEEKNRLTKTDLVAKHANFFHLVLDSG